MLFLLACIWTAGSLAGGQLVSALVAPAVAGIAGEAAAAAMLLGGFLLLARSFLTDLRSLSSVGFVRRPTAADEFGRGVALGWAVAIALVLPALLTGHLQLQFDSSPAAWLGIVNGLLRLALFCITVQLVVCGLPVRLLVRITSPAVAFLSAMVLTFVLVSQSAPASFTTALLPVIAVGMFVTGFLRTRALWFSFGLQLGWAVSQQVLFGTPDHYTPYVDGVIRSSGALFAFDPVDSVVALFLLLAAWMVILLVTRSYAWHYTYQPPVPGGFPMDVPPPAQHTAMATPQQAAPLIQISSPPSPARPPQQ